MRPGGLLCKNENPPLACGSLPPLSGGRKEAHGSFLYRVGERDAAEDFVELSALAVHAFDFPAVQVDEVDDLLRELRRLRLVARIDAEGAVQLLDAAESREALGARAARLERDGAGELRHVA